MSDAPGDVEMQVRGEGMGVYANLCGVQVTEDEVALHFLQRTGDNTADSVVKVFTSVGHARRLVMTMVQTFIQHDEQLKKRRAELSAAEGEEEDGVS